MSAIGWQMALNHEIKKYAPRIGYYFKPLAILIGAVSAFKLVQLVFEFQIATILGKVLQVYEGVVNWGAGIVLWFLRLFVSVPDIPDYAIHWVVLYALASGVCYRSFLYPEMVKHKIAPEREYAQPSRSWGETLYSLSWREKFELVFLPITLPLLVVFYLQALLMLLLTAPIFIVAAMVGAFLLYLPFPKKWLTKEQRQRKAECTIVALEFFYLLLALAAVCALNAFLT